MNWQNCLNGLDLHDDFIFDQQIQAVSVVNLKLTVVDDGHQLLSHDTQPVLSQFVHEAYPIDALEKPWPKF